LQVTTEGFKEAGRLLGRMHLPTVLVQEGGYPSIELGVNLAAVLEGFQAGRDGA
jgi:acetoin utilization deacetylase AcuC-like enzyme